ncbi:MAG TPA: DUF4221 family protein, partial [Cyclobacteriaceae bacterium]|nr:DUF4221 family protein [Cyclobacteriaceae bacterium]
GTKPTRKTEDALFALPYARIGSPMFKKGDWLYMPCVTQIPFFTENKRLFERGKSLLGVNIRTSEIRFQLNYPTPYSIKNPYFPPQFTQAVLADIPGTDKIVASFPVDHNVQVYDIRADLQEEHPIQSAELKNIPPMKSLEMDYNMHSEHFMNTAYYEKIIFDPYRKIYIRTVRYPDKVNPYIVGEDNSKYRRRYTALVADDNFHLLSEVNLSENGITNMNFFYTAEALYFQFRETSEDEIAFRKVIYKAIQ